MGLWFSSIYMCIFWSHDISHAGCERDMPQVGNSAETKETIWIRKHVTMQKCSCWKKTEPNLTESNLQIQTMRRLPDQNLTPKFDFYTHLCTAEDSISIRIFAPQKNRGANCWEQMCCAKDAAEIILCNEEQCIYPFEIWKTTCLYSLYSTHLPMYCIVGLL